MSVKVEDVMNMKGAVLQGWDFIGTVAVSFSLTRDSVFFSKFIVAWETLADAPSVESWLEVEFTNAVLDVLKVGLENGYQVTGETMWRGWGEFMLPGDMDFRAEWTGD